MCDFTLISAYYLGLNPAHGVCKTHLWLHFSPGQGNNFKGMSIPAALAGTGRARGGGEPVSGVTKMNYSTLSGEHI